MMSKAPLLQHPLINYIRENSSFSRRDIMSFIKNGLVTVNGNIIHDANKLISKGDLIFVDGTKIYKKNYCITNSINPRMSYLLTRIQKEEKTLVSL